MKNHSVQKGNDFYLKCLLVLQIPNILELFEIGLSMDFIPSEQYKIQYYVSVIKQFIWHKIS